MPVRPEHRFVDPTGPRNVAAVRPPKWHTLTDPTDSLATAIVVERGEPSRRRDDYVEAVQQQLGLYLVSYPFEGYTVSDEERRKLARRIVDEELRAGGGLLVYRGLVLWHLEQLRAAEVAVATPDPAEAPVESRLRIDAGWLVAETGTHTCGTATSGYYGQHEPGCGLEALMPLTELERILDREGAASELPAETVRTLTAWTPPGSDERESLPAHVTADEGLELALSYDLDGEGRTVPDASILFDRPGDLLELAASAVDAAVLQLAGSHANGRHLAEGITADELERRLGALEAAVARLRYRAPVWASGERTARSGATVTDPWSSAPTEPPPF